MILQNYAEFKSSKIQQRTMDFNVREYEVFFFKYGFRFGIATNF